MEAATLLAPGLGPLVKAGAHSGCFHCSREGFAAARISRTCGRVKLLSGFCPALPPHFPIPGPSWKSVWGPCGTLRQEIAEKKFTYATNRNLLFENVKPLKARVEVGVGSCSWGPLGYTEGGGTWGTVWWDMWGLWRGQGLGSRGDSGLSFCLGFQTRGTQPVSDISDYIADYTAGQIIKRGRK